MAGVRSAVVDFPAADDPERKKAQESGQNQFNYNIMSQVTGEEGHLSQTGEALCNVYDRGCYTGQKNAGR